MPLDGTANAAPPCTIMLPDPFTSLAPGEMAKVAVFVTITVGSTVLLSTEFTLNVPEPETVRVGDVPKNLGIALRDMVLPTSFSSSVQNVTERRMNTSLSFDPVPPILEMAKSECHGRIVCASPAMSSPILNTGESPERFNPPAPM